MVMQNLKGLKSEEQELEAAAKRMAEFAAKQPNYLNVPYPDDLDTVGSVLAGNPAELAKRYGLDKSTSKENG